MGSDDSYQPNTIELHDTYQIVKCNWNIFVNGLYKVHFAYIFRGVSWDICLFFRSFAMKPETDRKSVV